MLQQKSKQLFNSEQYNLENGKHTIPEFNNGKSDVQISRKSSNSDSNSEMNDV